MRPSTEVRSPLRQRMIEDMRMRKLEPKTSTADLSTAKTLTAVLQRSLATATVEDLQSTALGSCRNIQGNT